MTDFNYDPAMVSYPRRAAQKVRVTLGAWDYRKTVDVVIGGNCMGIPVLEAAADQVKTLFPTGVVLERENGDTLQVELDMGPDFMDDLIIGVEVIAIVPWTEREKLVWGEV